MGFFDWLLTDPTEADGGFLARILLDRRPAGNSWADATGNSGGSLLGESPLINLLRSGFAGMNAADGYAGFGPQFAAGVKGGAEAAAERRQQLVDQVNALKLKQALQAKVGLSDSGAKDEEAAPADKPCPACARAAAAMARRQAAGAGSAPSLPVIVASPDEATKLPPGTWFKLPDGRVRQSGAAEAFNEG